MADELYLSFEALESSANKFGELGDDLTAHVPIPACETGIVDISAALTTIGDNATALAQHLSTLATITREVKNEVITVDAQQQKRYPNPFGSGPFYTPYNSPLTPYLAEPLPTDPGNPPVVVPPLGTVPPSYVNPDGQGGQHLDLPPELTPMGPYAPGKDPR